MAKRFVDVETMPGLTEPRLEFTFYGGDSPEDRERRAGLQAIAQRLAYAAELEVSHEREDQHVWFYVAGALDKLVKLTAAALAEAELRWPKSATWSVGLEVPEGASTAACKAMAEAVPGVHLSADTVDGVVVP